MRALMLVLLGILIAGSPLPAQARKARLELESGDAPDWAFEAERFLRSRIAL